MFLAALFLIAKNWNGNSNVYQIMVYPYNGLPLSNKKEMSDTHRDESPNNHDE